LEEAISRLETVLDSSPDHPAALHNLARIEGSRGQDRAEDLFRRAIEGYESSGEQVGRIWALMDLTFFLGELGRLADAEDTLAVAQRVAEELDDDNLRIKVAILGGIQAEKRSDYGRALRLYREAEAAAFPDGKTGAKQDILGGLGRVSSSLGRYEEAIAYFTREAELVRSTGHTQREAVARYNIALEAQTAWQSGLIPREEFDRMAAQALDTSIRGRHPTAEASTRILIARHLEPAESLNEIDAALEILVETGHWDTRQFALRIKARKMFDLGPARRDEAFRLIEEAVAQARAAGDFENAARAMNTRAGMLMATEQRQPAIDALDELLEGIDRLREIQSDPEIRARHFGTWRSAYQAYVDYLVEEDVDHAFRVAERARARALLDAFEAADIPPDEDVDHPLEKQRVKVLEDIAGIQRRLMDPELSEELRTENLDRLASLESEEAELRDRLVRLQSGDGSPWENGYAGLSEVREALAPDQALLYFELRHTGSRRHLFLPIGPSFVLAISRGGVSRHEVPPSDELVSRIEIFRGLLLQEDASMERPAVRLYRDLLDGAVRALPAGTKRLVIVPDLPLQLLPFESLKESGDTDPLGVRFSISHAPSATAWLRMQRSGPEGGTDRVLSLADPVYGFHRDDGTLRQKNPWAAGLNVAPLPFARREGDQVSNLGEDGSISLKGADASEAALKRELGDGSYSIVHFGTHAVLDHRHPERTAVLLAPGDDGEDGLLQMREIVELDLADALVILSACSSATGEQIEGEGVMGLAHAFFRAGARTVVAATIPLQDEETARLMGYFARRLGEGSSVATALTEARRECHAQDIPVRAWAGLVVLGDGDYQPYKADVDHRALYWVVGIVLLATGAAWLWTRFKRS
jgi:CHAT domain-containing protein